MVEDRYKFANICFGLGGCGERLGLQIQEHFGIPAHMVNFSLDSESERRVRFFDYGGTGRSPELGKSFYLANQEMARSYIHKVLSDQEIQRIVVCVGLGGGSGSGILIPFLEDLCTVNARNFNVYLLGILPEDDLELRRRALLDIKAVRGIFKKMGHRVSFFLADNNYIQKKQKVDSSSAYAEINRHILRPFFYFTRLGMYQEGWRESWKKLDFRDFLTILNIGGFADFRTYDVMRQKWVSLYSDVQDLVKLKAYLLGIESLDNEDDKKKIKEVGHLTSKRFKNVFHVRAAHLNRGVNFEAVLLCTGMPLSKRFKRVTGEIVRGFMRIEKKVKDTADDDIKQLETLDLFS